MRWGADGRVKRGGVRTFSCGGLDDDVCYMEYVYAKNEQGDLITTQLRTLARAVRDEFE